MVQYTMAGCMWKAGGSRGCSSKNLEALEQQSLRMKPQSKAEGLEGSLVWFLTAGLKKLESDVRR